MKFDNLSQGKQTLSAFFGDIILVVEIRDLVKEVQLLKTLLRLTKSAFKFIKPNSITFFIFITKRNNLQTFKNCFDSNVFEFS